MYSNGLGNELNCLQYHDIWKVSDLTVPASLCFLLSLFSCCDMKHQAIALQSIENGKTW
jgi:hypothetical protein